MLFLLSPAKSLDFESPAVAEPASPTAPLFPKDSAELIGVLKKKSRAQVAALMDLSDSLAELNVGRYRAFRVRGTPPVAREAAFAFDGDVYDGLKARELTARDIAWAQEHLCILSGLYGVLRPLDLMQPYRLEMGTSLATKRGANLYAFWGPRISAYLNERQSGEKSPVVVNLASQEYFRSVDRKTLGARVVECVFEERRAGSWKIISFSAKRARGTMARYAVRHRVQSVKKLEAFAEDGYAFDASASTPERLVFRREGAPA